MKNKNLTLVLGLFLLFSLLGPLSAQEKGGTQPSEWKYDYSLSITSRTLSPIDNQDTVREYDRRAYRALDLSEFNLKGTTKTNLVNFNVQDLLSTGWTDASLDWESPYVSLGAESDGLFHRLSRFNQNWVMNGVRQMAPTGTTAITGEVNVADRNLSDSYWMDRRANEVNLKVGRFDQVRIVANYWSDRDTGQFRLWTKDFTATDFEHPQTARTWPLERITSYLEAGLEGPVVKWPVSYRFHNSTFSDSTPSVSLGTFWTSATALSGLASRGQGFYMFPSFKTYGHRFTLAMPYKENVGASIQFNVKDRDNLVTGYRQRLGTTRANGFWQPHPNWGLSGAFYSHDRSTDINRAWVAPDPTDLGLGVFDYDRKAYSLDARYYGWKWGAFGVGYRAETARRTNTALFNNMNTEYLKMRDTYLIQPLDPNGFSQANSKRTFYLDFGAHPNNKWNFSAHYSSSSASEDDFNRGVPGNNSHLTADVSFTPTPQQLWYLNYNNNLGKSAQYSYEEKLSSLLAGVWMDYKKWNLGLSYGTEDQDTTSWIYWAGWRPKNQPLGPLPANATTHMFTPERQTYTSRDNTWTVNTRVPVTARVSLDAAYTNTNSRGTQPSTLFNNLQNIGGTFVNAGINGGGFTNLVSEINTVDVLWTQFNVGLDFLINAERSKMRLDWFSGSWRDAVDSSLTGSYNSLWLTGNKKF